MRRHRRRHRVRPPAPRSGAPRLRGLTRSLSPGDYVEKQLLATGYVKEGCILSAEDGSLWASSPDTFIPRAYLAKVTLDSGEEKEMLVNEADDLASVARTLQKPVAGLRVNHQKYTITRSMPTGSEDDGLKTLYFKKPMGGGCLCVTRQCIIIGTFDEAAGQTAQSCNLAVETLARFLKQNSF